MVVRVQLFLNDQRLIRSYLNEIKEGMRVWQLAHVYGDLVIRAAQKVGPRGVFHLTDVTPIQIEHSQRKLNGMEWTKIIRCDAASFAGEASIDYDLICSFFLLHEVPDEKKHEIVNNMLANLPKGSKAVFVDYHNPAVWHPVRYILKLVNRYLEPFADALWKTKSAVTRPRPIALPGANVLCLAGFTSASRSSTSRSLNTRTGEGSCRILPTEPMHC